MPKDKKNSAKIPILNALINLYETSRSVVHQDELVIYLYSGGYPSSRESILMNLLRYRRRGSIKSWREGRVHYYEPNKRTYETIEYLTRKRAKPQRSGDDLRDKNLERMTLLKRLEDKDKEIQKLNADVSLLQSALSMFSRPRAFPLYVREYEMKPYIEKESGERRMIPFKLRNLPVFWDGEKYVVPVKKYVKSTQDSHTQSHVVDESVNGGVENSESPELGIINMGLTKWVGEQKKIINDKTYAAKQLKILRAKFGKKRLERLIEESRRLKTEIPDFASITRPLERFQSNSKEKPS